MKNEKKPEKVALLSVFNKDGIVEFARTLKNMGWKLLASGGTAQTLKNAGLEVKDVADLVGGGAILGHRVVTLSREIHAGLLARDIPEDNAELDRLGIPRIDLLCSDLYPLELAIAAGKTMPEVIEMTDIGGPTLIRSAAKGRRIVICNPRDRMVVLGWMTSGELDKESFLNMLAAKAEMTVARYALSSARFISGGEFDGFLGQRYLECLYGENAPQTPAGVFSARTSDLLALDKLRLLTETSSSYNNTCDHDRLLQTITHIAAGFDLNFGEVPYIAVAVKHGNPCGVGVGKTPEEALKKMIDGDLRAILGGIVMTNFLIDETAAKILAVYQVPVRKRRLLDGIICPVITDKAVAMLERKKAKCRILMNPALAELNEKSLDTAPRLRCVRGGFMVQPNYTFILDLNHPEMKKFGQATPEQKRAMVLAWAIAATANSNTIALVKDGMLVGLGSGQQDRVGACKVACFRADESGHDIFGAIAASDSFFPFDDGPRALADRGVKVIFSTSGSINDQAVIDFCQENGIVLYMLPDKVARGFFGH
ncbi:MAG: hypothetical protein PHT51_01540 [Patescibacteria group bacterium]|nr:hypothetical protein [Patescibacteria group bacterium]